MFFGTYTSDQLNFITEADTNFLFLVKVYAGIGALDGVHLMNGVKPETDFWVIGKYKRKDKDENVLHTTYVSNYHEDTHNSSGSIDLSWVKGKPLLVQIFVIKGFNFRNDKCINVIENIFYASSK